MSVVIYQNEVGWILKIGNVKRQYARLIYAIRDAQLLQLHIDNRKSLPA